MSFILLSCGNAARHGLPDLMRGGRRVCKSPSPYSSHAVPVDEPNGCSSLFIRHDVRDYQGNVIRDHGIPQRLPVRAIFVFISLERREAPPAQPPAGSEIVPPSGRRAGLTMHPKRATKSRAGLATAAIGRLARAAPPDPVWTEATRAGLAQR